MVRRVADSDLIELVEPLPDYEQRVSLPFGNAGTEKTINEMQKLVTHHKRSWPVRVQLGQIIWNSGVEPKDYYGYAKAIYEFCRDEIRYVFDPNGVEMIETPERILESKIADCDSIVVLMASLFESAGLPARFKTVKADKNRPDEWSHIFLEVNVPGRGWIGADATMPNHDFGWEPPDSLVSKTWPASLDTNERGTDGMGSLNDLRYYPPSWPNQPAVSVNVNRWAEFPMTATGVPTENQLEDAVAGLSGYMNDYASVTAQFYTLWDSFMNGIYNQPWSRSSSISGDVDSIHDALLVFKNTALPMVQSGAMTDDSALSSLNIIANHIDKITPTINAMSNTNTPSVSVPTPSIFDMSFLTFPSASPSTPGTPVAKKAVAQKGGSAPAPKTLYWVMGGVAVLAVAFLAWRHRD